MSEEQFHEFHLDGKQMVFLFMASTVVAVVIFLCGVMVGRGVRSNRAVEPVLAANGAGLDPTVSFASPEPTTAPASSTPEATDSQDDLTAAPSSNSPVPPAEALRPASSPRVAEKAPDPPRKTTEAPAVKATSGNREPPGSGFVVQVMSITARAEAISVSNGLIAKGYPSFVSPTKKGKLHYRVRVGKYRTRKEAEAVAARLEKVENFRKPWITR